MATQIKRKPLFVIMVGLNKETTKNEPGMRGYLADTLSKTDKLNRKSEETKKYFINEVYHHMEKVKLVEEEKRNIWYFEWNVFIDLRQRLLDNHEMLLVNAHFYFLKDYSKFTIPNASNPKTQQQQQQTQYQQQNNDKKNNKPPQIQKPLKSAWNDDENSSSQEEEAINLKNKSQSDNTHKYNQRKQIIQYRVKNSENDQDKEIDKNKNGKQNGNSKDQDKQQQQEQDDISSKSELIGDSEGEENNEDAQEECEEYINQIQNKEDILNEIAKYKQENEKLQELQDIEKLKADNVALKKQLEAVEKKMNKKAQVYSDLQNYILNIQKEIEAK